jgi:hypothetical protein
MNKRLAYGLALAAMPILGWAQTNTADIPPPSPPFVQFPGPDAAFTIDVMAPNGQAAPAPAANPAGIKTAAPEKKLVRVDAVQTGRLRCDTLTWDDHSQTQTWFVGKYGLVQSNRGNWINLVDPVMYPIQASAMLRRDASDYFHWLTSANYAGVTSYKGKQCYQFKVGAPATAPNDDNDLETVLGRDEKIAWVDVKTKLPVAIQIQGQLFTYTFHDAPTDQLTLPPKFQAMVDRFQLLGPPASPAQ